jgi:hypothetical protein
VNEGANRTPTATAHARPISQAGCNLPFSKLNSQTEIIQPFVWQVRMRVSVSVSVSVCARVWYEYAMNETMGAVMRAAWCDCACGREVARSCARAAMCLHHCQPTLFAACHSRTHEQGG